MIKEEQRQIRIKELTSQIKAYKRTIRRNHEITMETLKNFIERLKTEMWVEEHHNEKFYRAMFTDKDLNEILNGFIKEIGAEK